ncbi:hypothetical protein SUGI_1019570 [Cryptomeria japonica]|uniref:transcription factor bHLH30 isoform X1 n=1 Tax=Cryptomeria japonica TaxID=3369 RepID=UPI002414A418|nr:transcription factor bHLH30 isoform X1 [Cryptomeria japonica]GLJ48306.1 hypothetical protein SUGI_1019570 [Cryptomeria japonica]
MAMFTGNPSLHKTMAELSFHQQFRKEQVLSSSGFSLPNSVSRFTDIPAGAFPFSYRRQSNLAVSYSNNNVPEVVDGSRFYPQYFAQNGGSLVLDCSRGELVNASKLTLKEISEAKALAASKSHSEAERRRRERINSHLATLKSLLPSITKTDKASLLAEAIKHVKDLKRRAAEFAKTGPLPMDVDELQVEEDAAAEEGRILIKASLCCDDRPDLMSDLIQTFKTLGLRAIKAEISTLAGRVKKVFHMTKSEEKSEENQEMVSINYIREALKAVIERATASGESSASPISNKRQRILPYDG